MDMRMLEINKENIPINVSFYALAVIFFVTSLGRARAFTLFSPN